MPLFLQVSTVSCHVRAGRVKRCGKHLPKLWFWNSLWGLRPTLIYQSSPLVSPYTLMFLPKLLTLLMQFLSGHNLTYIQGLMESLLPLKCPRSWDPRKALVSESCRVLAELHNHVDYKLLTDRCHTLHLLCVTLHAYSNTRHAMGP